MELSSRRCSVSPILFAVIFITLFGNVLSRHRIRHFRERFKRQQGAHLYLPGSYVTEGDNVADEGPWEEWSEPSVCSRTCGGGVASQYRECTPGYTCRGPHSRHFSCNTQDCPDISDYRSQQCAEFDSIPFEGSQFQWVPYTKAPNPCELNCMPRGERFYFRHKEAVVDGTRCSDESVDVCVNGTCQPVGCDMMLGSSAREDACRICGGDGTTCNTLQQELPMQDMQQGYNDILLIPAGATNIKVAEVAPSNNYLAVRNTSNYYYLNGNWRIDFPRTLDFAGCKFHYERSPQGFPAPDILSCLGPTEESLFIVLLYQEGDVPVSYTYSIPKNVVSGLESEPYAWTFDQYTPCSASCGGGYQYRNVSCAGRKSLEPVDRSLCDEKTEPESSKKCNEIACDAQWVPQPWKKCSAPCGDGGVQTRDISCQQIVSNGLPTLADDSECLKLHPKPSIEQKCNVGKTCSEWHEGPWKPCDHLCGEGLQRRNITCYKKNKEGKIEVLEDASCEAIQPKPNATKKCNLRPCEGVDWIISEWSGCDRICGLTEETRKIFCATRDGTVYSDDLCDVEQKPEAKRKCTSTNATCEYLWYASQWSECSVTCGDGVQTRTLFCGVATPEGVKKVENDKCDPSKHFETVKDCKGESECEGEWFSGPWGKCSKSCGGGTRSKKVVCLRDNQVVPSTSCGVDKIVFSDEECNTQPCSDDGIIPTNATQSVDESEPTTVMDEAATEIYSVTEESGATTEESDKEITTEPSDSISDDEFETVEDTSCDDGEWVEVGDEPGLKGPKPEKNKALPEDKSSSKLSTEPQSTYDLMLSDGTTIDDFTGSGDESGTGATDFTREELFTGSTKISESTDDDEEGSGTEPTIVSDSLATDITIITSGQTGLSSESTKDSLNITTESTDVSGSTETGISSASSSSHQTSERSVTVSGSTDSSDSSGSSDSATVSSTSSDVSLSSDSSDTTESSVSTTVATSDSSDTSSDSSSTSRSDSTDGTTESGVTKSTDTSETNSKGTRETSVPTESPNTIVTGTSESTESSESTVTSSTDITQSTESDPTDSTVSSSTDSSQSTDSTISTESFSTESTSLSTDISGSSETSASSSDISGSTETTESSSDISGSTETTASSSEITGSTASFAPPLILVEPNESGPIIESSFILPPVSRSTTDSTKSSGTSTAGGTGSTFEDSTVVSGSTIEATSTIASGPTTEVVSESSTEVSESSTDVSGSTTEVSESSTEVSRSTTEVSESSTEVSRSTTEVSETSTEISRSTTDVSELSIEVSGLTTEISESTTEVSETTIDFTGSTTEIYESTYSSTAFDEDLFGTSPAFTFFTTEKPGKLKLCRRRKIKKCKTSEFGCCWDNITPAQGPFDKGCPEPHTCKESKFGCCEDGVSPALGPMNAGCPPSHCNETLFGCCPDNRTEATGPDSEGCPVEILTTTTAPTEETSEFFTTEEYLTTTETETSKNCTEATYRCCPDGVTTATGPGFRGCGLNCSETLFGCCPDEKTAAHGSTGEGCCLLSTFGCCWDDITPASGLNKQGCECQLSPYGCCPDNSTSARGYNNEGCGCQYSEHGCCPDNFTPSTGPEHEGCPCHTYQFGCCPDGVTVAKSIYKQDCSCENTEYGCCSDDKTPAAAPNQGGCGCETTKFGCCLDGISVATGENFEGCTETLPDRQISCSLPKERGTCRNYTVKWFYDMEYGGCSRFWYGGCDGNDNRYKTKEECEQVCVEPKGADRCNLPKVTGPCEGYYPQWHYDKDQKRCAQFVYGGCLGNNNRFETSQECSQLCVKDSTENSCEQPKEEGPCKGQYPRFYYSKELGRCEQFNYGGCKGNGNNFPGLEACNQQCSPPGQRKEHCSLPKAEGNCTEQQPKWYYDTPENRCTPYYYSGCNGNDNNFDTREACTTECPSDFEKDTCQLPAITGECADYVSRFYYDTREKSCRQFYYGGCGGNGNNFETLEQCEGRCFHNKPQPQPVTPSIIQSVTFPPEHCFLPIDPGPCLNASIKYHYDKNDGVCKSFTYGGCRGNDNQFDSVEDCYKYCGDVQDLCSLPLIVGPCNGRNTQFYYDQSTDSCQPFNYGGCGGNYNRFPDPGSCEQRCRKSSPPEVTEPSVPQAQAMCYQEPHSGNCTDSYASFFFDAQTNRCSSFTYTGCGGNQNRFNSEEQCERQCGAFRDQDVCNMDQESGPCRGYFVKFYYDRLTRHCEQFVYGGCQGNGNRFSSVEECEQICLVHDEPKPNNTNSAICQLSVNQGTCQGVTNEKRWYFDNDRGECLPFIYTGCGGNFNNFKSFQSCKDFCRDLVVQAPVPAPATEQPEHPCQEVFDECATIRCPYGIQAYVDSNDCNRCQCRNPCKDMECQQDEQCAIDINRNKTSIDDANFVAVCRKINKEGTCPNLFQSEDGNCDSDCRTDADCSLHLKCCMVGCRSTCLDPAPPPAPLITQPPEAAFTVPPVEIGYQPPQIDTAAFEPVVSAPLGDQAVLRCAVTGNPNPRIRWSKEGYEIEGTEAKYRIKLDQSLQIITLHKTDSGIYICTADNGVGKAVRNQISLNIVDSGPKKVSILEPEANQPVVVSLNAPTTLNCFALGNPFPHVTWWKDNQFVPLKNNEFEQRQDYSLHIHSVKIFNLGVYTCQAYNGLGKAASWSVTVRAKGPYKFTRPEEERYREYIVNPPDHPEEVTTTIRTTTALTTTPLPTNPPRFPSNELFNNQPVLVVVPVRANITTVEQRYPVGGNIEIPCAIQGNPEPQVKWYKDGVPIISSEKIDITDSYTLKIYQATKADSGKYQCEARNIYSVASSTLELSVEGMYIHPNCKDSPFLANCSLIVKWRYCGHKYYAKFCCRSCTEAGQLPADSPYLQSNLV